MKNIFSVGIEYVISQVFARTAVPALFVISSLLLFYYRKEFIWIVNFKKKIKSLLVPYFILNTLWILLFLNCQNISVLRVMFSNTQFQISHWGRAEWIDAYLGYSGMPLLYPLWFLRDIFFINLISAVLKNIIDRMPVIYLTEIFCGWIFNLKTGMFCCSIQSLFFWSLGYYLVKYKIYFSIFDTINKKILICSYFLLVILDVGLYSTVVYTVIHQVYILCGTLLLFWIGNAECLGHSKILAIYCRI